MKTFTRLLLIPLLAAQVAYAPKAQAVDWTSLAVGGLIGAGLTYAILSNNDQSTMNSNMAFGFRGSLHLGDHTDMWHGENTSGYYVYDAQGRSADGLYNNCRRVVPVAFNNQTQQPLNMQNYQPTYACQKDPSNPNAWIRISVNNFVPTQVYQQPPPQNIQAPMNYPCLTYANNSPFGIQSQVGYNYNPYAPFNQNYLGPRQPITPTNGAVSQVYQSQYQPVSNSQYQVCQQQYQNYQNYMNYNPPPQNYQPPYQYNNPDGNLGLHLGLTFQ